MTITVPRAPRRAALTALAGLALLPVAGCGGDEKATSASGEGLARLAPVSAPFYAEAAVRPTGDVKTDLDALIAKFAPGKTVDGVTAQAFDSSSDLDFERDIKPWLGERAAVAITGLSAAEGADPDFAAIVDTTDSAKALGAARKESSGTQEERTYNEAKYFINTTDKSVVAVLEDKLIGATEPAFKAIVDASKGDGLDSNKDFAKTVDAVDDDALGFMYGDLRRVFDLAMASSASPADAQQLESTKELFNRQGLKTIAAGFVATDSTMKVRAAVAMKDNGQGEATAETVAALPAGSWAAAGLGDIGKGLSDALDSLKSFSAPGFDVQSGLDQLEQQAGIDVQKDLIAWMGQTGLFVRGTTITDLGGALVVQSKDPAATRAALAKARTIVAGAGLPAQDLTGSGIDDGFSVQPAGAPFEVFAALAGERFVLAVNRSAFDDAINPSKKLTEDDVFKTASETLGDGLKPTFFIDFPKIAGFIGATAAGQAGYAEAKPYLDRIGAIVAGSKRNGDLSLSTFAVQVR